MIICTSTGQACHAEICNAGGWPCSKLTAEEVAQNAARLESFRPKPPDPEPFKIED